MAVNAATSSYVNNASSGKGFSGLASGVDTESMVEELLSGTQSKIDKQEGVKQQLQWKQEIYRDIITKINAFQSKFFSYSSSSNLASSSFWNSLSVFANSSAFKASATNSATTGTSSIAVRRLATKSSLTSGMSVSGSLKGSLDLDALRGKLDEQLEGDYSVKFKVGDTTVDVDLSDVFLGDYGVTFTKKTTTQLDSAIQKKLQTAFDEAETKVKVKVEDGKISISNTDFSSYAKNITVSADSGALGLERLGLTAGAMAAKTSEKNNNIETVTYTLTSTVDPAPTMEFTVTLDDSKKTISLDMRDLLGQYGELNVDGFKDVLQAALNKAHGAGQIKVKETPDGGFSLEVSNGRKVDIGGGADVLAVFGMKNGDSNRISLSKTLGDLNLGTPLRGDSYRFTINGEEFHFTKDTTLVDMMDAINRSGAGVRMVYRAQDDKFVLESKEYGAGREINLDQTSGNLLTALFGTGNGVESVGTVASERLPSGYDFGNTKGKIFAGMVLIEDPNAEEDETDPKMVPPDPATVLLKDLKYTYTVPNDADPENPTEVTETLADLLDLDEVDFDGLGLDKDTVTLDDLDALGYIYKVDDDGNVTIQKKVDENTKLSDLGYTFGGIDGVDGETTLGELEGLTNGKLLYYNGYFILDGYYADSTDEATAKTLNDLFGAGIAIGREPDSFTTVDGQNSEVMIDGIITERSSNNFTVNGINYDISDITGSYSDLFYKVKQEDGSYLCYASEEAATNGGEPIDPTNLQEILKAFPDLTETDLVLVDGEYKKFTGTSETVTVKQDTDTIINAVKEFIDEYNVLVKTLNDLLDEDTNYRDYPPLTSAQKAEMSEREIELWEKKAKEGLLHRDSTIQDFLQQMRTALYQKPPGAKYALYELGIETGEWEMKGQLAFTVNGETNLRSLLENDPSGVSALFTGVNGLGTTLNDILKATASTSSGSPGTLVRIAGLKDSDTTSSIYNQLKAIDEKIEMLKNQYEAEKTRYWNQFNTMEQMISNMNTQSAYLAQMMGLSY